MSPTPDSSPRTPRRLTRLAGALSTITLVVAAPSSVAAQPWDGPRNQERQQHRQMRSDNQQMPRCMCEDRRQWREEARQANRPRGRILGDAGWRAREQWRQIAREEAAVRATDRLAWHDTRQLRVSPSTHRPDRSYIENVRWQQALDSPEVVTDVQDESVSVEGRIREIQRPGRLVHGLQFVRLTLEDGAEHLLALRPDAAARMRLATGETISLEGMRIAFGNEQAVIVHKAEVAGRSLDLSDGQAGVEAAQASLEGRVKSLQRSDQLIHGYILYRIRMQDGRQQVLAVRPDHAAKLQFKQGDQITIKGSRLSFGTEDAIIVEEVSSEADQVGSR